MVERRAFGMETHLRTWKSRIEQMPILVQASEGDATEGEDEEEGFHCVCGGEGGRVGAAGPVYRGRWNQPLGSSTERQAESSGELLVFTSQDPVPEEYRYESSGGFTEPGRGEGE